MFNLERYWPVIVTLVVLLGIRFVRYMQWKWTRDADTHYQLSWILQIYSQGFACAVVAFFIGLYTTDVQTRNDFPKVVGDINTPDKVLEFVQLQHQTLHTARHVLMWFIFFCFGWVTSLLAAIRSELMIKPNYHYPSLPGDLR